MSVVSTPVISPNQESLERLIESVLIDKPEILKNVLRENPGIFKNVLRENPEILKDVLRENPGILKTQLTELMVEDKAFNEYFSALVLTQTAGTSKDNIQKDVRILKECIGLVDKDILDTETINERVSKLEAHVLSEEPTQKTKNERRADHFMKSPPIGLVAKEGIVIKSKVWRHWVRTLPEELKTKSFQNIRKLKIDLFNLLEKLFPDRVYLIQDKTGLKEWKLIIKSVT